MALSHRKIVSYQFTCTAVLEQAREQTRWVVGKADLTFEELRTEARPVSVKLILHHTRPHRGSRTQLWRHSPKAATDK